MQIINGKSALLDSRPLECVFTDACNEGAVGHLEVTGSISTGLRIGLRLMNFISMKMKSLQLHL